MHSVYNSNFVFNVNPSYSFSEIPLKLLASYIARLILHQVSTNCILLMEFELNSWRKVTVEAGSSLLDKNWPLIPLLSKRRANLDSIRIRYLCSNYVNIVGRNNAKGVETMLILFRVRWRLMQIIHLLKWKSFKQINPKHKGNIF
jgi:vitamin B12 transporter